MDLVKEVNRLLDQAFETKFPRKIKGNRDFCSLGSVKIKYLKDIFELRWFGLFEAPIGEFTSKDGSALEISPVYEGQAQVYAQLYKARYGKDVNINLR